MGDPDPTDLINAETNRIPFRVENFFFRSMEGHFPTVAKPHQMMERLVFKGQQNE